MPSSAAYELAGPVHIASESAKLARARFLKLIGIPTFFCRIDCGRRALRHHFKLGKRVTFVTFRSVRHWRRCGPSGPFLADTVAKVKNRTTLKPGFAPTSERGS